MSRAPAHPLRRRFRSIWPISDLSADPMVMLPARTLGANQVSFVPESRWPLALEWRRPVNRTAGSGDAGRPSPNGGVVARKELKVYFFLPHARPVPVKSWCCTSWFGQWSPDPPSSATAGLPVPGRRRVTWRPPLSRTAGSGDHCRTKTGARRRFDCSRTLHPHTDLRMRESVHSPMISKSRFSRRCVDNQAS